MKTNQHKKRHYDEAILAAFVFRELGWIQRYQIKRHIALCPMCRKKVEAYVRVRNGFRYTKTMSCPRNLSTFAISQTKTRTVKSHYTAIGVGFAFTALFIFMIGFIHFSRPPEYSSRQINEAKQQTHQALALLGDILGETNHSVEHSVMPRILLPFETAAQTVTRQLKLGEYKK